jgi:VWFA-related protein
MNARRAVVAMAVMPLILRAQTPSAVPGPIRAESRAVSIDVLVRNKETGVPIDGLTAAQFTVRDEGRVQKLSAFRAGTDARPLALAIVVESNALTFRAAPLLASAARPAFEHLRPDDEVMILRLFPGANIVQDLTRDRDAAARALESVAVRKTPDERRASKRGPGKVDGKTAASDVRIGVSTALMLAAQQIHSRRPDARAVIVVLTADLNIVPPRVVTETAEHLIASDVSVYGLIDIENHLIGGAKTLIHVIDSRPDIHLTQRDQTVASYSAQTGGALYDVKDGDFGAALGEVFKDLAASYSLAFVPDSQRLDGKFHSLDVEVHPADKAAVRIGARKRYWASTADTIAESTGAADPAAGPNAGTDVPMEEGLYYRSGDSWMRWAEAGLPQWKVTGVFVSALTYGIKRPSFLQEYDGAQARRRIDGASPVFMLRRKIDPQALRLTVFDFRNGVRAMDVAAVFDTKGRKEIPLKIERVASGVFRIVPANALPPGEYLLGMNDLAAPAWDFGFSGAGK